MSVEKERKVDLNFKVPVSFHVCFKVEAARKRVSMATLLREMQQHYEVAQAKQG